MTLITPLCLRHPLPLCHQVLTSWVCLNTPGLLYLGPLCGLFPLPEITHPMYLHSPLPNPLQVVAQKLLSRYRRSLIKLRFQIPNHPHPSFAVPLLCSSFLHRICHLVIHYVIYLCIRSIVYYLSSWNIISRKESIFGLPTDKFCLK